MNILTNVLYITYDGITDPLGQSQILPYLIKLSERGFQITIISLEKHDRFIKNKELINLQIKNSHISWKPLHYSNKLPLLSQLFNVQKLKRQALKFAKKNKVEIVHCRSYLPMFAGLKVKEKHSSKLVFDMRGFWADERIEGDIWNTNNFIFKQLYNYLKRQEKVFLHKADAIISLTNTAKNEMKKWGIPSEKITVIPCCVDTDFFDYHKIDNEKLKALKSSLNLQENDLVISYLGSIGTWYLTKEMLLFFKNILSKYANAKLLFITQEKESLIIELAECFEIPLTAIVIKSADRNQVPYYISLSNISMFFIKSSFSKRASSPTKLAEILALGVPVIANGNVGDLDAIFSSHQCGILLNDFKEEEFKNVINQIDNLLVIPKDLLRNIAITEFSLIEGVNRYLKVYNDLCN